VARRWLVFNGVGALGFLVQFATLALLVLGLNLHYLAATAAAVEMAILHNFFWHQRLTWRDRPASGILETLARLGRFHLLNGSISIAGNLILMTVLTGALGMPPLPANLVAVLSCSILNYAVSDALVFRTAAMALLAVVAVPSLGGPVYAGELASAQLKPETIAAWERYSEAVDSRYERPQASEAFFVHDLFKADPQWRQKARRGAIVMFAPAGPRPGAAATDVPDGKIHHWVGAVFIPGATLDRVLNTLLINAGHEADSYADVLASRLIERNGDALRVFMKIRREAPLITVTYNTEHAVVYRRFDDAHAASRSAAVKIAELSNAGTPQEQEKPQGHDSGFLWRLNAYWRYEQVDGGVLIECESVSLSRSIPFVVRPLLTGTVERIARESLEKTLRTLRTVLSAGTTRPAGAGAI
jgi:putative flippase GtrA